MDTPTARIRISDTKPPTPRPVQCTHLYRDFRTESGNGKVSRVYFYCQKCLDIQIKIL